MIWSKFPRHHRCAFLYYHFYSEYDALLKALIYGTDAYLMVVNCRETVHNRPKDVISGGKINHEFEIFCIKEKELRKWE